MLLPKLFLISIIIFACAAGISAQIKENFTYLELLTQQKSERDERKQTQQEILDKILQRQKEEIESVAGYSGTIQRMQEQHQTERENIVKILTTEREKQMQIQADERKQFTQNPK